MTNFFHALQNLSMVIFYIILLILALDYLFYKILALPFFLSRQFSILDGTLLGGKPVIPENYQSDENTWFAGYINEAKAVFAHIQWRPYTYWASKQFKGNYINITSKGIRQTLNYTSQDKNPIKIYMFGGSTMWGWGARDDYTIPSCVARCLYEKYGLIAEVVNFAELGYVSTQEVICLFRELQSENIPNFVINYDGLNDTFSSYQMKRAGLPQNEPNRELEFNCTKGQLFKRMIAMNSGFVSLRNFLSPNTDQAFIFKNKYQETTLINKTAKTYLNNLKMLNAVSQAYDYKLLAYWQPTIFDKNILTPNEKQMLESHKIWQDFYFQVKKNILENADSLYFKDLSNSFNDISFPVYIDPWHIDEKANEKIATKIADDILTSLQVNKSNH